MKVTHIKGWDGEEREYGRGEKWALYWGELIGVEEVRGNEVRVSVEGMNGDILVGTVSMEELRGMLCEMVAFVNETLVKIGCGVEEMYQKRKETETNREEVLE